MSDIAILQADARRIPLASETVQCIVTSPPYWGLRKYAGEQGEEPYGLEPTIGAYIAHTVEILRECRRVLRKDGVCFWNVGDSYHNGDKGGYRKGRLSPASELQQSNMASDVIGAPNRNPQAGLKPKDLCLIPARVALAAQSDGWWVRSLIIWAKPNPMPESCHDRPTDAYEHIILLSKSERYFWDADAVREPQSGNAHSRGTENGNAAYQQARESYHGFASPQLEVPGGRNLRNVWTFPTQPYPGAHFATFPEEIPRRAILAGTSAKGACCQCGTPWRRVTQRSVTFASGSGRAAAKRAEGRVPGGWHQSGSGRWRPEDVERFSDELRHAGGKNGEEAAAHNDQTESGDYDIRMGPQIDARTIGWRPGCKCCGQHGRTRPCLVLDPFGGSGTTGRVAAELNRRAVLLDLAYHDHQQQRTRGVQRMLAGLV